MFFGIRERPTYGGGEAGGAVVPLTAVFFRLFLLPFRSVWVVGDDPNVEIGFQGVGEDAALGILPMGEGPAG